MVENNAQCTMHNAQLNKNELDLSVDIAGVILKNPVITASGTCGFGRE